MMKLHMAVIALIGLAIPMSLAGQGRVLPVAAPPSGSLAALNSLEPGQWALRGMSRTSGNRAVCVSDGHALLQIRHGSASCSRFVIANEPRSVTVHYTCPGAGHGRTTIRVASAGLVQIDTQGIIDNAPFQASWEARHAGACAARTPPSVH